MYNLELGLWERLQLNLCLPRDANWQEMEQLVRISKALALTNEENESIGLETVRVPTQHGTIETKSWDEEKLSQAENIQTVTLKAVDFECLKKHAGGRTNWPRGEESLVLRGKFESAVED